MYIFLMLILRKEIQHCMEIMGILSEIAEVPIDEILAPEHVDQRPKRQEGPEGDGRLEGAFLQKPLWDTNHGAHERGGKHREEYSLPACEHTDHCKQFHITAPHAFLFREKIISINNCQEQTTA